VIPFREGVVKGFLHRPETPNGVGLVVTRGAGANAAAPMLVAVAEFLTETGVTVLRCDLPFRQKRPFGPPPPSAGNEDRAGLEAAVQAMRRIAGGPVVLGGHSYGGRQSTMLAAEKPGVCDALVLFSYPLHPPDKPAQARTAHLPNLQTPSLFIHGTKDPFGTIEEMTAALKLIPGRTELKIIEGAGHDLKKGKFDLNFLKAYFAAVA
jgi:uncharacterized protein